MGFFLLEVLTLAILQSWFQFSISVFLNISSLIPTLNTFCRWMNGTATKAFSWTQKDFFIVQSRCYQHPKTKLLLLHHWRHLDKCLIFHLDRRLGDTKSCHWIHHGWPSGSPPSISSHPLKCHRKESYMSQHSISIYRRQKQSSCLSFSTLVTITLVADTTSRRRRCWSSLVDTTTISISQALRWLIIAMENTGEKLLPFLRQEEVF